MFSISPSGRPQKSVFLYMKDVFRKYINTLSLPVSANTQT